MTDLLSIDVKIEDEDKIINLLSFLSKSYKTLVTTLLKTSYIKKSSGIMNGNRVLLATLEYREVEVNHEERIMVRGMVVLIFLF